MPEPNHNSYKRPATAAEEESASSTSTSSDEPPKKLSFWERGFRSLVAFQKKHGHTNVPYRYDEDRTLGTWTARQRKHKDELTEEQRQRLAAIGFTWQSTQDRAWMEKFDRLKAYFEREGHSCVPTSFPEDPELGEWTAKQRQKETQGRLSQERRSLLDSVQFVYRINKFIKRKSTAREDKKWWEQFERLVQFLLEHGHTLVPFQYFADKSLGRWVNEQRCQHMRGLLREDRREILSNIGFVWKVNSRKGELILEEQADDNSHWAFMFRQLVEYQQVTGTFPTSQQQNQQGSSSSSFLLSQWANEQRQLMEQGKLEEMKVQRMAAIGFCQAGEEAIWNMNYEKLQHQGYNSIYTLEDRGLSHWVILQRYLYKKGKLSQPRKMRLFDIPGFVWDSTPLNLPRPECKHILKEKLRTHHPTNNKNVGGGSGASVHANKENKKPLVAVKGKIKSSSTTSTTTTTSSLSTTATTASKSSSVIHDKSMPVKKRKPVMDCSTDFTTTHASNNQNFCGLLAIASSFRANEKL